MSRFSDVSHPKTVEITGFVLSIICHALGIAAYLLILWKHT